MSFALCYWVLMLVWLVVGFVACPPARGNGYGVGTIGLFILLLLLGWKVFGSPIQ